MCRQNRLGILQECHCGGEIVGGDSILGLGEQVGDVSLGLIQGLLHILKAAERHRVIRIEFEGLT